MVPGSAVRVASPVVLLIVLLALGGCRRGDDEDCRAVANHYASMVEDAVDESGEAKLVEDTQAHLPTLKDAVERACTAHEWPRGTRRCILAAESVAALDDCDPAAANPDGESGKDETGKDEAAKDETAKEDRQKGSAQ